MEDIYIFGSSGYAREIALLNNEISKYSIKAFVDINTSETSLKVKDRLYPIISESDFLNICKKHKTHAFIAISTTKISYNIIKKFANYCFFPNLVHPSSILGGAIHMGVGNIITYNCVFTDNIAIGSFNRFNIGVTVGHDVTIGNNNQFNPMCNISGNIKIGNNNLFGVNSVLLQGIEIQDNINIGASSLVIKKITEPGTYFGIPASKLFY